MIGKLTHTARAAWIRLQKQFLLTREVIQLLRSPSDGSLATLAALIVAAGLCPVALVYVMRGTVDRLVAATRAGGEWTTVMPFVLWAAAGGALILLGQALGAALDWARAQHEERLKEHITERIHQQSVRLDLAFYESPEFFDRLHRARDEANYRPAELCRAFIDVSQGVVVLGGLSALLLAFGPWLPILLFLAAIPVLSIVSAHALEYQRWRRSVSQDERRTWYYDAVLTSPDHAAELRVFGIDREFRARHRRLRAILRDAHLKLIRRRGVAETSASAASSLVMAGTLGWMAWRTILGLATLGQLAAFYQAFASGLSTMRALLGGLARIRANGLFIEGLLEFLALEPGIVSPTDPIAVPSRLQHGLRFRNVTFYYPGASKPALDRFNLHVPAGHIAAIVGMNGAGKSTLLKLACRLYDPLEGSIEIDGIDIRRFDLDELRTLVSALFQPSGKYFESAGSNIRFGAPSATLTDTDIRRASDAAGASDVIDALPRGYDTSLGKLFDSGTEISAGEWQRIGFARALARPAEILLLDEPTSSLDPWAEGDWYRRLRKAVAGQTVLIVTHRLQAAMQADVIHVMENGRIVESGTHDDLVSRDGRYAACVADAADDILAPFALARS